MNYITTQSALLYVYLCLQEVDLTHGRLKVIPPVLARLTQVEVLTLRQNLIKDVGPITDLCTLKDLDLYDNELTETPDVSKWKSLV